MIKKNIIENKLSLFDILFEQFGAIVTYEMSLILCSFFVDREIIEIIQIILLPVFILYLVSNFNKPILEVDVDYENSQFTFKKAYFARVCSSIQIPFNEIEFVQKGKWLMNYYHNVVEIKHLGEAKIVIPKNKKNSSFTESLIKEFEDLNGESTPKSIRTKKCH
jgi:hypothetical protein